MLGLHWMYWPDWIYKSVLGGIGGISVLKGRALRHWCAEWGIGGSAVLWGH